jgi:23S rRNA pseudouridine2605 synthase/16S rRNA pseudouridine516 synthase
MKKKVQEEKVRINKYLAMCGVASRRAADELVLDGKVSVNGRIADEPGFKVDPRNDEVIVDGRLMARPEAKKVYILFNKPRNVITTTHDERDRQQILDFIDVRERVFPVGRLDRKSTGLLLLTNDGTLAHRLMHPSSLVQKEYLAVLDEKFPPSMLQKLTGGMRLKDTGEKVSLCKAKIIDDGMSVLVSIHEGKNHQVRRMFSTLGFEVKRLDRVAYAGLTAGELRRGEWRFLSRKEVERLYRLCGDQ